MGFSRLTLLVLGLLTLFIFGSPLLLAQRSQSKSASPLDQPDLQLIVTPTATVTMTPTLTLTATPPMSATATLTMTSTAIATPTASAMATMTSTATTPTATQTTTATPSMTPTATATPTVPSYAAYLPITVNTVSDIDLTISHLEITQATQDEDNSVPLVEARRTIVRIYAETNEDDPTEGVAAAISATRNGQPLGTVEVGPAAVPPSPARGDYASTFNLVLPEAWLSGEVTLTAEIDSDGAVFEFDETNNTLTDTFDFNPVPTLDLKIVPVNYTHQPSGAYFPYYPANNQAIIDYLLRIFPLHEIDVSYRAPIYYTGNLSTSNGWDALTTLIGDIKVADGSPSSQVYYGLVANTNASGGTYYPYFWGYGYIGFRASSGLIEYAGRIASHELGHNFGRIHSPCGTTSILDPTYPYPNASIGEYGLDVFNQLLWPPQTTKDLMSYCDPQWISDYNYRAVFEDQVINGLSFPSPPADGLFVRLRVDGDEEAAFLPTYNLTSRLSGLHKAGAYTLDLLDATGHTLAEHPVRAYVVGEEDVMTRRISVVVPRPEEPVATLRLTREGEVVAEQTLDALPLPTELGRVERDRERLRVRWSRADVPALVRVVSEDGTTTTLGVDALGGQLLVDPESVPEGATVEINYAR